MTETSTAPTESLTALGPERVLALVDSLPEWRRDLDDDPVWIREVELVGLDVDLFSLSPAKASLRAIEEGRRPLVPVPVADIKTAGQRFVRLDAIAHYLRHPNELFDRDGWFGQDHPVLFRYPDGTYRVLDGTNRTAAARIRRDPVLPAYVLDYADLSA